MSNYYYTKKEIEIILTKNKQSKEKLNITRL